MKDIETRSFTSGELRYVCGLSHRVLDSWCRKGVATPSIQEASGKGTERRWSYEDLVSTYTLSRLHALGLRLPILATMFGAETNEEFLLMAAPVSITVDMKRVQRDVAWKVGCLDIKHRGRPRKRTIQ